MPLWCLPSQVSLAFRLLAYRIPYSGIVNLTRSRRPSWPLSLERGQPYRRAKDFSAPNRRATEGRRIPPLLKLTMPSVRQKGFGLRQLGALGRGRFAQRHHLLIGVVGRRAVARLLGGAGGAGRQQAELRPACRRNAVHNRVDRDSRESVDADFGALADRDMGELGFLVVRDDPDLVRHDGDDLCPGVDVLPGADVAFADFASRGGYAGIAQVDFGQIDRRLFGFGIRAQLHFLSVEHRHLAVLRLEIYVRLRRRLPAQYGEEAQVCTDSPLEGNGFELGSARFRLRFLASSSTRTTTVRPLDFFALAVFVECSHCSFP
jgi:hypothetical protein